MVVVNGKEKEGNLEIEIEDSIVVIICGDIELERLKGCIKTLKDIKLAGDGEQK